MSESQEKLPEWMLKLENKRKKQHRLAHEIGAGAPCFVCQDACPGLDLHFWRKLCRNCKCKKEDHDVKDDEGYEQFEILLGNTSRKSKKGGFLKINVSEDATSPVVPPNNSSNGVSFDWLPPNVSEEVAAEYMQQLPASKLPISGSDGALYRRQQMTKQVPLHDLDARHCHNLTPEEIEQLMKYLENLKSNVVGQGSVGKVPALYTESRTLVPGSTLLHSVNEPGGRLLVSSQSADPIRPLPPMPPAYNSMPRPFQASSSSSAYGSGEDDDLPPPPPLPTSLPPRTDLKTPSEFLPEWRLPDDRAAALGKVVEEMNDLQLNQQDIPSYHVKDAFAKETPLSNSYSKQQPQFSGNLTSSHFSSRYNAEVPYEQHILYQYGDKGMTPLGSRLQTDDPHEAGMAISREYATQQGSAVLQSHLVGNPNAVRYVHTMLEPKHDALSGSRVPSGVAVNIAGINSDDSTALPARSTQVLSVFPKGTANSSTILERGVPLSSKPLTGLRNAGGGLADPRRASDDASQTLPMSVAEQSVLPPNEVAVSEAVKGAWTTAKPLGGGGGGGERIDMSNVSSAHQTQLPDGENRYRAHPAHIGGKGLQPLSSHLKYGMPGMNQDSIVPALPVDGLMTSSVIPHTTVQSSAVHTDALPKSAQMIQQLPAAVNPSLTSAFAGSTGPLPAETPGGTVPHLDCHECKLKLVAGDVAVFAERAGSAAWHPSCFVCSTCKELLVDLMYFYHKDNVYCGRHFADLLGIPRCFACDELIFGKEYTVAEGKVFHVKHFCCYECDDPLAGKQYIPVDDQPVCLECYERKYGKQCHTCQRKIAAGEQRVGWKHLSWHVQGNCFRCFECTKSLLGGRFVVKENQPFCSKECVQAGLEKMAGAA